MAEHCISPTCRVLPCPLGVFVQGSHDIAHGSGDPHFVLFTVVWLEELVIRQRERSDSARARVDTPRETLRLAPHGHITQKLLKNKKKKKETCT